MELITYNEALDVLERGKIDTIRHAVSRGDLTRAGRQKRNIFLIKEQVELFKGRKISRESLNPSDRIKWERYANEVHKAQASGTTIDEEAVRRIAQESYSQQFISMIDAIKALVEGGVPEGAFFREHPILGGILYALLIAASMAGAFVLFRALNSQEKKEVMAYLGLLDTILEKQETMPEPPISIDEIRERRERIALFKQQAEAEAEAA